MLNIINIFTLALCLAVLAFLAKFMFDSRKMIFRELRLARWQWAATTIFFCILAVSIITQPWMLSLYYDDFYALEIASDFASGTKGYDEQIFPFFVANALFYIPGFVLFGQSHSTAMAISVAISFVSVIVLFFTAKLMTGRFHSALASASILGFYPIFQLYIESSYNPIASFLFVVLALFNLQLYFRGSNASLYASVLSLFYAALMRIELLLLVPFFAASVHFHGKRRPVGPVLLALTLTAACLIKNWNYLPYLRHLQPVNFAGNLLHVPGDVHIQLWFIALAALGLLMAKNKSHLAIGAGAVSLGLLYMFLEYDRVTVGWHYTNVVGILSIFAGMGIFRALASVLKKFRYRAIIMHASLILLISAMFAMEMYSPLRTEPEFGQYYFDTRVPYYAQDLIPDDCTVVGMQRAKYAPFMNQKVIRYSQYSADGCAVFIRDLSCDHEAFGVDAACSRFLQDNEFEQIRIIDTDDISIPYDQNLSAGLYRAG